MEKRRLQPTAAIPVVEQIPVNLDQAERRRLRRLAQDLLVSEPALNATAVFAPNVTAGCLPGPAVLIEDHSAISLFTRQQLAVYDYRPLLLAGTGDTVVIGVCRNPTFESYCRDVLRLGAPEVRMVAAASAKASRSLALCAADDAALVTRLAARARRAGGLTVVPYMGTGGIWNLAARIATVSQTAVRVAAPPPRLTRRVNDKSWFTQRVREILGQQAVPASESVYSRAALAACVARFARSCPSVAVKIPDSASSQGNLVLDAEDLHRLSLSALLDKLLEQLNEAGWRGFFPLLVTAWEQPVLSSPSVQLWIPGPDDGAPVVEGIFDQAVLGPKAAFSGATPSVLSTALAQRMAEDAVRLATFLQALGYFGRCSFDALLVGGDEETAQRHWVECNGRWGGVSLPMTLANRLLGDWTRAAPVIVDRIVTHGHGRPLQEVVEQLGKELYRPGSAGGGVVLLAPERIERGTGIQAMALDSSLAASHIRARDLEEKLLSLMSAELVEGRTA